MNILNGIQNFLQLINDNWTTIMVIIGLVLMIVQKVKDYIGKSDEEKIEIAKTQIQEAMLRMVAEAEVDYEEWSQAGSIKRSQVIEEIFAAYPVLSKVADQTALIEWIDGVIDEALKTLRAVIQSNKTDD